jgi:hypothetical protein
VCRPFHLCVCRGAPLRRVKYIYSKAPPAPTVTPSVTANEPFGVRVLMVRTMLGRVTAILAVSAAEPPRSMLPRSASLELDDVSWLHEPSEAALHAGRHRVKYNHRRTEALTAENTAPIRIVVDYGSLYEETAPTYSACFTEGAWFARGLPDGGLTPPEDGVATCVRGADEWQPMPKTGPAGPAS